MKIRGFGVPYCSGFVLLCVFLCGRATLAVASSLPEVPPIPPEVAERIDAAKKNPIPAEFAGYEKLFNTWYTGEWEAVHRMRERVRKEKCIVICEPTSITLFRGVGDSPSSRLPGGWDKKGYPLQIKKTEWWLEFGISPPSGLGIFYKFDNEMGLRASQSGFDATFQCQ